MIIGVAERDEAVAPASVHPAPAGAVDQVDFSVLADDPEWDAFLAERPDARHVQTSWWAQTKAPLGWRAARVLIRRDGRIAAGAQVLARPIRGLGAVAHVVRGPVAVSDDPALTTLVLDGIDRISREGRIRYLVVQPPAERAAIIPSLTRRGFRLGFPDIEPNPSATVVVDLRKSPDELLAAMKDKTRYNIRLAQRKGVTVRQGSEADLERCHELLAATGERQGFPIPSRDYFLNMWRLLHPRGHLRMFLAEYEGEAIASLLAIPFGDTVTFKFGGWSGQHGNRHPNELMHWVAMQWARDAGFRWYDFESLDPELAQAVLGGAPPSGPQARSVATFKLGFGGEVRSLPGAYERVSNPLLRLAYNPFSSLLMSSPRMRAALKRVGKVMRAR